MNELVSIIIPTYNRRDRLHKSLLTVINQDYSPIEIIVVDDGSTDHTEEMVADLIKTDQKLPQILFYYKIKNSGAPTARNFGFQKARGKFVIFFDSDDLMIKERVRKQVSILESTQSDCCACGYYINEIGGKTYLPPVSSINMMKDYIKKKLKGSTQSWIYKRSLVEAVGGYDPTMRCYQDSDLTFRILLTNPKVVIMAEPLSIFIDHNGADRIMSNWTSKSSLESICRYYEKMVSHYVKSRDYGLAYVSQLSFLKSVLPSFLSLRAYADINHQKRHHFEMISTLPPAYQALLKSGFIINLITQSAKFYIKKMLGRSN
ncbi:glycosyltransferase family 2 protein [Dyadobacter aurulentus]|uniref:glycosyltransferase family 2 protein n=1 Tax=Dyadobacter sp. UC 10 TaxID=2605428 RepID=UPI0011F0E070|nr:glycosyltransferase family 2 protein [Dyadobacter sp. UC 10]KAA0988872.1 glycosyltransferase family 2 protein [Dyadobacter sp. UC 10]